MARSIKKAWWVLTFVFAAVQMVIMLFPINLPIGGTGAYFSIDLISAPVIGFLLGPLYGTMSVFLGAFVAAAIDPWAAGLFGSFPILGAVLAGIVPAIGALVAGLIKKGRYRTVSLFFIVTIALFLFTTVGMLVYGFLWMHIVALFLSFLFLIPQLKKHLVNGLNLSDGTSYSISAIAIWLLVFISVMADHLTASVVRALMFMLLSAPVSPQVPVYTTVISIYPLERLIASIAGGIVTFLIAIAIARTNLKLPTRPIHEEEVIPFEPSSLEALTMSGSGEKATS